jgi:hypothetical protein
MKQLTSTLLIAAAALMCVPAIPAQPAPKKDAQPQKQTGARQRLSPHETISTYVGGDRRSGSLVTITYGRPYRQRGGKGEVRKIWGGLVPWAKADRLGADEATTIMTQHPIEIGGRTIPAGAYTLYIVPSQHGTSKLAFSRNIGKWGVPVDETQDVARVDLKKDRLDPVVEQLTIAIEPTTGNSALLKIMWDDTQWSVPFSVRK